MRTPARYQNAQADSGLFTLQLPHGLTLQLDVMSPMHNQIQDGVGYRGAPKLRIPVVRWDLACKQQGAVVGLEIHDFKQGWPEVRGR